MCGMKNTPHMSADKQTSSTLRAWLLHLIFSLDSMLVLIIDADRISAQYPCT
jgi:hypothetical protein